MCVTGFVSSTIVEVQQELTTAHAELWQLGEGPRVLLLTTSHAASLPLGLFMAAHRSSAPPEPTACMKVVLPRDVQLLHQGPEPGAARRPCRYLADCSSCWHSCCWVIRGLCLPKRATGMLYIYLNN